MGASTWAFGSQRWTPYRGILTKKASRQPAHHSLSAYEESCIVLEKGRVRRERVPVSFWRRRSATRRGSDPARV